MINIINSVRPYVQAYATLLAMKRLGLPAYGGGHFALQWMHDHPNEVAVEIMDYKCRYGKSNNSRKEVKKWFSLRLKTLKKEMGREVL